MADPNEVRVLVVVRFRSRLSEDELRRRYRARMPEFRRLPGLVQKYYFHDESSGEWGGVYLWDSVESMQEYMSSDLRKTIPTVYEIEGAPRVDVLPVVETLR